MCFRNSYVKITLTFLQSTLGSKRQWWSVSTVPLRTRRTSTSQLKTLSYIDVLPKLVKSYNNTYHRSIKMKPSQVTKSNEAKVWDTVW